MRWRQNTLTSFSWKGGIYYVGNSEWNSSFSDTDSNGFLSGWSCIYRKNNREDRDGCYYKSWQSDCKYHFAVTSW